MTHWGCTFGVKFRPGFNMKLLRQQAGNDRYAHNRLLETLKSEYASQGWVNCTRGRISKLYTDLRQEVPFLQKTVSRISRDKLFQLGQNYELYVETKRKKAAGERVEWEFGEPHFKVYGEALSIPLSITHDRSVGSARFLDERTIKISKLGVIKLSRAFPMLNFRPKTATLYQTNDGKWRMGVSCDIEESKAEESKAEESKAEESKAEESKAEESKAEESKAEESKAEESKAEESKAEESKAEESKAEESKELCVIGIDRNIGNVATKDYIIMPPARVTKRLRNLDDTTRRTQRVMSRRQRPNRKAKTPGSKRYQRARIRVARRQRELANIRKNIVYKTVRVLNGMGIDCAVPEGINTKNMTKSAKGTKDKPGKHVRQKSGLNRSILDQDWGLLRMILAYALAGGVIVVDPAYTSQTCSWCGHIDKDNRRGRLFWCVRCGFIHHADMNAACNIENRGRRSKGMEPIRISPIMVGPAQAYSVWAQRVSLASSPAMRAR